MAWQVSPFGNQQFFDSNGNLAVGYQLFTYLAGTSTKVAVARDATGTSFHTNPIVLNAVGLPPSPIYIDPLHFYKFVYAPPSDSDPPVSPVYTADYVGVSPFPALTVDQWVVGTTPTYVSSTQFSVTGDQTATYARGRRVKLTNSSPASTAYGTISAASFAAGVTTVTVEFDAGDSINSSLTAVSYGLLTGPFGSVPVLLPTDVSVKKPYPSLRLIGQEVNGKDYLIREVDGTLISYVNTGTEAAPIWTEDDFLARPGDMKAVAYSTVPGGWLPCNGAAISRTTYARLFAAIGTTYGAGDGVTTFNVPDKRGRTSIGAGQGAGLTNRVQGAKLGTENETAPLPSHNHGGGPFIYNASLYGSPSCVIPKASAPAGDPCGTIGIASDGPGGTHNNMPPSEVDLWIIKT